MLQERDQRRGHGDDLPRRDVHVVDLVGLDLLEVGAVADLHALLEEVPGAVQRRARLRDDEAILLVGGEQLDLVFHEGPHRHRVDARVREPRLHGGRDHVAGLADLPAAGPAQGRGEQLPHQRLGPHRQLRDHAPVGRLDEAELVDHAVGGEAADEADVGALRRLDGADAAVVAVMHIAHVEAGPVAAQAAGAQRAQPALVRQLRQRVGLIHELAQLAAAEELLHRGDDGADVDQRARRRLLGVRDRHALADHALHAQQAHAELVQDQLAHGADAAIAQVVDVVPLVLAVVDPDLLLDDRQHVGQAQRALVRVTAQQRGQPLIELVAPHAAQVVAPRIEEQAVQQPARVVGRRRVAGAQLAVHLQQRPGLAAVLAVERRGLLGQGRLQVRVQRVAVRAGQHRADAFVAAQQRLVRDLGVGIDRPQQRRDRNLALAVDLDGQQVAVAGLELQPGAAVGDQLRRAEFAAGGGVGDGAEIGPRGAHQLRDDDALGAVDHERARRRHQREVAEEELLLLDLPAVLDDELHRDAQRRRVGEVALAALVLGVRRQVQPVAAEDKLHALAGEVLDRGELVEELPQSLVQEPVVGVELDPDQVGQRVPLRDRRVHAALFGHETAPNRAAGGLAGGGRHDRGALLCGERVCGELASGELVSGEPGGDGTVRTEPGESRRGGGGRWRRGAARRPTTPGWGSRPMTAGPKSGIVASLQNNASSTWEAGLDHEACTVNPCTATGHQRGPLVSRIRVWGMRGQG